MDREDEILDTLKKILATEQASLEISRDFQRQAQENKAANESMKARTVYALKAAKFNKYFNLAMGVVLIVVIAYGWYKLESLPSHR
jgi:hypothetical protein